MNPPGTRPDPPPSSAEPPSSTGGCPGGQGATGSRKLGPLPLTSTCHVPAVLGTRNHPTGRERETPTPAGEPSLRPPGPSAHPPTSGEGGKQPLSRRISNQTPRRGAAPARPGVRVCLSPARQTCRLPVPQSPHLCNGVMTTGPEVERCQRHPQSRLTIPEERK